VRIETNDIYNWSDLKKKGTGMDIKLQIIMVCRSKW